MYKVGGKDMPLFVKHDYTFWIILADAGTFCI
jgi:hypothetical protein